MRSRVPDALRIDWRFVASRTKPVIAIAAAILLPFVAFYDFIAVSYLKDHVPGEDLRIYMEASTRLFSGGSWYLDRQLHGPYEILPGDVLFPVTTAPFFWTWNVLPMPLFWILPAAFFAWFLWQIRPQPLAWLVMPLFFLIEGPFRLWFGNPDIWVIAVVAAGLIWRWPAALVFLKPSVFPLAFIGVRSRAWWVLSALIGITMLPFALQYVRVALDGQGGGLLYSIRVVPMLMIPVVAWLGRTRDPQPGRGLRLGSLPKLPDRTKQPGPPGQPDRPDRAQGPNRR